MTLLLGSRMHSPSHPDVTAAAVRGGPDGGRYAERLDVDRGTRPNLSALLASQGVPSRGVRIYG
jgi:hypothetical protein